MARDTIMQQLQRVDPIYLRMRAADASKSKPELVALFADMLRALEDGRASADANALGDEHGPLITGPHGEEYTRLLHQLSTHPQPSTREECEGHLQFIKDAVPSSLKAAWDLVAPETEDAFRVLDFFFQLDG